ncbi:MAG: T9SS type A sorting domain-containing protein [Flavobacteriales bacterium]|nr:T9SS type A sorting domain-containing protein [Flavobacteriales bacterium]
MKQLLTLAFLLPFAASAQTTHQVSVGGSLVGGTPPFYSPQNLTIAVGDIVQWTNSSGSHNVNGSTQLFPGNPQGFSSGAVAGGAWNFSHTFTIPGVYNYHCTANGHSATQFGQITVVNTTSVAELDEEQVVLLYPVPTNDVLTVESTSFEFQNARVITLDGRVVAEHAVNGRTRVEISTADLAAGQYFLLLNDKQDRTISRPFRKE